MRRSSRGFTLLEVLAAVLIFAVVFTVLAGVASEAFRSEGANRRRIEASLLADERLDRLEDGKPEIGEESEEEDIFRISTSVSPLSADMLGLELETTRDRERARDRDREARQRDDATASTSILSPEGPAKDAPLRRIDLLVEWDEGDRTLAVRRSTIVLDTSSLGDAFPGGGGGDDDNPLGGAAGADDDGDDSELGGDEDAIQRMIEALGGLQ